MTETPRDPSGPSERTPEYSTDYGSAPPPPPPAGSQPPGYTPPPAYTPPAPGTEAPAAQPVPPSQPDAGYPAPPAGYETPPPAGYQPPPSGYQAPPADYQAPPAAAAGYQEQPPAVPGAFQAAGAGFSYDRTALQNFDPRSVNSLDWGIIAAGVVAFIFSLFKFYKYTLTVGGVHEASDTVSSWHGFFGWFGALVALLAALLLAADLIARIKFPFATRLVVLGAFVIALICELLALLIVPGDTGGLNGAFGVRIDKGHSFGYWITLIAVIVGTGLAYKRFTDTGGKLPRR
jgi:hypothetical protein